MGNIGGEIVTGAFGAVGHLITGVPLIVWLILGVGVVIFGILMRYLTNIKVDAVIVVVFILVNLIIYYRAHFIDEGYNEALSQVKMAEAKVAAYKKTNAAIEACYARNTNATILWDRTNGDCVRADGSHL